MTTTNVRLKIVLNYTKPPIWRRVEVPAEFTLDELHAVIQAAMGWEDQHLYEFQVGRERIAGPMLDEWDGFGPRPVSASRVRIRDVVARDVKRFIYVYDMGDGWDHTIRIEKILPDDPATAFPRLIGGAIACPPEDCGGVPGFYDLIDTLADPDHPDHKQVLEWYGGAFDPDALDIERIHARLKALAARRRRTAARRLSDKRAHTGP